MLAHPLCGRLRTLPPALPPPRIWRTLLHAATYPGAIRTAAGLHRLLTAKPAMLLSLRRCRPKEAKKDTSTIFDGLDDEDDDFLVGGNTPKKATAAKMAQVGCPPSRPAMIVVRISQGHRPGQRAWATHCSFGGNPLSLTAWTGGLPPLPHPAPALPKMPAVLAV